MICSMSLKACSNAYAFLHTKRGKLGQGTKKGKQKKKKRLAKEGAGKKERGRVRAGKRKGRQKEKTVDTTDIEIQVLVHELQESDWLVLLFAR